MLHSFYISNTMFAGLQMSNLEIKPFPWKFFPWIIHISGKKKNPWIFPWKFVLGQIINCSGDRCSARNKYFHGEEYSFQRILT